MMRRAVVRGCVSVEVNSKARPVAPAVQIESTSQSAIRALSLGDRLPGDHFHLSRSSIIATFTSLGT
jgi:hypothetical protein